MNSDIPDKLRLADGRDVPHAIGTRVFNYYDMEEGTIWGLADRPEPDTSGLLPGGHAWWIDFKSLVDGHVTMLDGSRMVTIETAKQKGWLR